MGSLQAEFFISAPATPVGLPSGFAEADWPGDRDYPVAPTEPLIDDLVAAIEAAIDQGRETGHLDAYYARRAAFDLQSIRSQIVRERRLGGAGLTPEGRRAIISRLDRLQRCLGTRASAASRL